MTDLDPDNYSSLIGWASPCRRFWLTGGIDVLCFFWWTVQWKLWILVWKFTREKIVLSAEQMLGTDDGEYPHFVLILLFLINVVKSLQWPFSTQCIEFSVCAQNGSIFLLMFSRILPRALLHMWVMLIYYCCSVCFGAIFLSVL